MVENTIRYGLQCDFFGHALCSYPRSYCAYRQLLDMVDPASLPVDAYLYAWKPQSQLKQKGER
jgi:hypothetical protein